MDLEIGGKSKCLFELALKKLQENIHRKYKLKNANVYKNTTLNFFS